MQMARIPSYRRLGKRLYFRWKVPGYLSTNKHSSTSITVMIQCHSGYILVHHCSISYSLKVPLLPPIIFPPWNQGHCTALALFCLCKLAQYTTTEMMGLIHTNLLSGF